MKDIKLVINNVEYNTKNAHVEVEFLIDNWNGTEEQFNKMINHYSWIDGFTLLELYNDGYVNDRALKMVSALQSLERDLKKERNTTMYITAEEFIGEGLNFSEVF